MLARKIERLGLSANNSVGNFKHFKFIFERLRKHGKFVIITSAALVIS
jgi:hypothetical protein